MEIKIEQLENSLQKGLQAVYLIASDEHLLLQESCETIRQAAKQQGFTESERLVAEKGFSWTQLNDANASMSLFGERKIIDLRIPNGKPGKEGSEAIVQYLEQPSPDNLLLIRCPQLNKQSLSAKWVKAISKQGIVCVIWKVKPPQLPMWIQQRVKKHGLQTDREGAQILAERVEGNLLAASQEIEKLSLLFPEGSTIQAKQIIQTVANNSRYDVFSFVDHCLAGDGRKALAMLRGLREERTDLTIISWALRKEIETLLNLSERSKQQSLAQCFKELRIWSSKQSLYNQSLKRIKTKKLEQLLVELADLDKTIKGRGKITSNPSADDLCESLVLKLSGVELAY